MSGTHRCGCSVGRRFSEEHTHAEEKIALITVHGIGGTSETYYEKLRQRIFDRLIHDAGKVSFHAVNYQHALKSNQQAVWDRMSRVDLRWDELCRFLMFGIADAAALETRKEIPDSVYEEAQLDIARKMWNARTAMGWDGPIVAIAHSFGWPLQPLLGGYEHWSRTGRSMPGQGGNWFKSLTPLCHTAYWDDNDVISALAQLVRKVL